MSTAYLVVLGERDAIRWVLAEQRMAFPATPRPEVAALSSGDRLLLYATRGAWHNPTRDRGRMIGSATVVSPVRALDPPVKMAGRTFHSGCQLDVNGVAYPGGSNCNRSSIGSRPSQSRTRGASTCDGHCSG